MVTNMLLNSSLSLSLVRVLFNGNLRDVALEVEGIFMWNVQIFCCVCVCVCAWKHVSFWKKFYGHIEIHMLRRLHTIQKKTWFFLLSGKRRLVLNISKDYVRMHNKEVSYPDILHTILLETLKRRGKKDTERHHRSCSFPPFSSAAPSGVAPRFKCCWWNN